MVRLLFTLAFISFATPSLAQENNTLEATPQVEAPMTLQRLSEIILVIDADARIQGAAMEFTVQDIPVIVIADPRADRMRAMVPIRSAEDLKQQDLLRMMQANFDSALDARYAVARGRLWGVFIHPLSPLKQDQFLSAVAQTVNVARTYGQTYSGGAQLFGGGDSNGIYQDLLDDLRKGQKL